MERRKDASSVKARYRLVVISGQPKAEGTACAGFEFYLHKLRRKYIETFMYYIIEVNHCISRSFQHGVILGVTKCGISRIEASRE